MRFVMFFAFLMASFLSFSQKQSTTVKSAETISPQQVVVGNSTNTTQLKTSQPAYHLKLSTSGNSGVTNSMTPAQEIENCQYHLSALDQKETYLRSNNDMSTPEMVKWLNDANATRQSLNERIELLK